LIGGKLKLIDCLVKRIINPYSVIMKYLLRAIVAVVLIISFTRCTKTKSAIENPVSAATPTSTAPTPNTDEVNENADTTNLALYTVAACSYIVQPSQWVVDGAKFAPGSVICIPAGTRGALLFKNLKGTSTNPIIIMNKGGRVTFTAAANASYTFKTQNCSNFKVLGNGATGISFGFRVSGGNIGMTMDDLSTDFEISNVEVVNSGFAGIMAKTDPTCDVKTQRGQFTMKNIKVHNNYIHKTGGEGIYIGNSFYADGRTLACGKVYPHNIVNLKVYSNRTDSTGCEGIQVGSAVTSCLVYNNTVKSPGRSPFASGQNNGIQIGEGTGGKCYNNLVKNAPGDGIIVLGLGDNLVYNNYIINAGVHGIFADSRYTPGPNFKFVNNTIIAPAVNGIKLNSESIPMNTVINNVIIKPGSGIAIQKKSNSVKLTASNNYVGTDINACKFVNYTGDDFHLQASSPFINKGASVSVYGISFDYYRKDRPAASLIDIGATEY